MSNPKIQLEFKNDSLTAFILPPLKTPISKYFIGLSLKSFNIVLYNCENLCFYQCYVY